MPGDAPARDERSSVREQGDDKEISPELMPDGAFEGSVHAEGEEAGEVKDEGDIEKGNVETGRQWNLPNLVICASDGLLAFATDTSYIIITLRPEHKVYSLQSQMNSEE